uniref:Uncharacterized protein n=1 Tax=Strongyloides stercoralis TaxID=6248 RepID=A0A0K0ERX2_STRER
MLNFFKIIVFLFLFITINIINCGGGDGGGDGGNMEGTRTSSSHTKSKKKHQISKGRKHGKPKDKKPTNGVKAAGKDVFKRPDVLGMANKDDPKYATLNKLNVTKLLEDVDVKKGQQSRKEVRNKTLKEIQNKEVQNKTQKETQKTPQIEPMEGQNNLENTQDGQQQ